MRTLLVALVFCCLSPLTQPSLAQPIGFRANQVTNLPSGVFEIDSLLQGDFNNDGKTDVVIVANDEIIFYPGSGSDVLGSPVVTTLTTYPFFAIAVAGDFNGDGYLDLVLMEQSSGSGGNQFVTMLGNGTGTFAASTTTPTPLTPTHLFTADFNHDGIADIAWININNGYGPETLEVQLGIGSGAFQAPRTVRLAAPVWAITTGDFNDDGKTDLALIEGQSGNIRSIQLLFGNGTGAFPHGEIIPADLGADLVSVAAGRFNGDSYQDLAVSTETGFAVLLGNGKGSFAAPLQYPTGTGGNISVADINGDGKLDILFLNSANFNGVTYTLGNGDGTFQPSVFTYQPAVAITTGDFDQDKITDVAAILQSGDAVEVTILLGSRAGLLVAPTLTVPGGPYSVPVSADFNRDGNLDLAVITGSGIAVYFGDGHGHWTSASLLAGFPVGIVAGDFNGDGVPDIAGVFYGSGFGPGTIDVYLGKGDGTFSDPVSTTGPPEMGSPVTGDFNGDGKLDIAVTSDPGYNPFAKGSVAVLLGNGNGSFSKATYYIGNDFPDGLAVADFNGDGIPDIAFGNYYTYSISLLTGKGDGGFLPPVTLATGTFSPRQIQAVDVNGDGRPDLVVAAGTVDLYLNQGNGKFILSLTNAPFGEGVVVADFNGDGIPDLASGTTSTVSIQQGNGDGTFQAPVLYGANGYYLTVGRFYGHSLLDVMTTDRGGVAFLVNTTGVNTSGASGVY